MKTILLLLFLFSISGVFAEVDEDCFCPLVYGEGGYFSNGQIYVDTCNQNYECSYSNFPFYFKTFEYITFDDNGLSDLDTGYIDFKNLPQEAQNFSNQINEFDSKYSIKSIYREFIFDTYLFKFEINTYQTEVSIDSSIVYDLKPIAIYYPQVFYLTNVDYQDKYKNTSFIIRDKTIRINSNIPIQSVRLFNIDGKEVLYSEFNLRRYIEMKIIDISTGLYFIILNGEYMFKFTNY